MELLIKLRESAQSTFTELGAIIRNPRTLSRKLRELTKQGLIEKKYKSYSLTQRGKRVAGLVEQLIGLLKPPPDLSGVERVPHPAFRPVLRRYCELLLDHFGERLIGALVFGSIARGDWTRVSDIDVAVIVKDWKIPSWERIRELMAVQKKLRDTPEYRGATAKGYAPIIQEYPLDEEEARLSQRIYIDACVEGIVLFERERFLTRVLAEFRKRMQQLGAKRVTLPTGEYYWILKEVKAGEVFEL